MIAAEDELDAFVNNLTARSSLGPEQWERGMAVRSRALEDARRQRDAAVRDETLLSVDLNDPTDHDLRAFAFSVIAAVYVGRGRGTDRLRVVWTSDDDEADA